MLGEVSLIGYLGGCLKHCQAAKSIYPDSEHTLAIALLKNSRSKFPLP